MKVEEDLGHASNAQVADQEHTTLAKLPAALLGRLWPAQRFVCGLRVCKTLHQDLVGHSLAILLKQGPPAIDETRFAEDFNRLSMRQAVSLQWRGDFTLLVSAAMRSNNCGIFKGLHFGQWPQREEGAMLCLSPLIRGCTYLETLSLMSSNLGPGDAEILSNALVACSSISELFLGGNVFGSEGAGHLAKSIEKQPGLQRLDLWRNEIEAGGALALGNALKSSSSLKRLDLGWNRLGSVGLTSIAEGLSRHCWLTSLSLCSNGLSAEGMSSLAAALKQSKAPLEYLNLDRNPIRDAGVKAVGQVLSECTTLLTLRLSHNQISAEGACHVADILCGCCRLELLNVSGNYLQAAGMARLSESISTCAKLKTLELGGNEVQAEGAAHLAKALSRLRELEVLDVQENAIGGGVELLAGDLAMCTALVVLDLSSNGIDSQGARALSPVWGQCPQLSYVNLHHNSIGRGGAESVAAGLSQRVQRREMDIDLTANEFSQEEISFLEEQFNHLAILRD